VPERTSTLQGRDTGFTFIELLVTSTLVVIVLMAVYTMYAASHTAYKKGLTKADVQQNARIALDQMIREIRLAGYESPTLTNPACPPPKKAISGCNDNAGILPTREAAHIHFRGDVDGDNVTEEVEYRLRKNNGASDCNPATDVVCELTRRERDWNPSTSAWGSWSAYQILATNIRGLAFTYVPSGNPVRVSIQVQVQETGAGQTLSFTVTSDVRLRNL